MRQPWIALIALCAACSGFVVGRLTVAPAPDQYEVMSVASGFGGRQITLRVNKKTGQSFWLSGTSWEPVK